MPRRTHNVSTAAHCLYTDAKELHDCVQSEHHPTPVHLWERVENEYLSVVGGSASLNDENSKAYQVVSSAHPDNFDSLQMNKAEVPNDIALLQVGEPMENVAKICLPTLTLPELTRGIELLETGFTKIKASNPHTNEEKQIVALTEVVIPVISDSFCKKMFEPLGYTSERMICGGSNNRKFIAGDSGTPLIQKVGDAFYQVGLASNEHILPTWTPNGIYSRNYPGTYVRVAFYCDWISRTTNNRAKCDDIPLLIPGSKEVLSRELCNDGQERFAELIAKTACRSCSTFLVDENGENEDCARCPSWNAN